MNFYALDEALSLSSSMSPCSVIFTCCQRQYSNMTASLQFTYRCLIKHCTVMPCASAKTIFLTSEELLRCLLRETQCSVHGNYYCLVSYD